MHDSTPLVGDGQGRTAGENVETITHGYRALLILLGLGACAAAFIDGIGPGAVGVAIAVFWFVLGWHERADEGDAAAYRRGVMAERERVRRGIAALAGKAAEGNGQCPN